MGFICLNVGSTIDQTSRKITTKEEIAMKNPPHQPVGGNETAPYITEYHEPFLIIRTNPRENNPIITTSSTILSGQSFSDKAHQDIMLELIYQSFPAKGTGRLTTFSGPLKGLASKKCREHSVVPGAISNSCRHGTETGYGFDLAAHGQDRSMLQGWEKLVGFKKRGFLMKTEKISVQSGNCVFSLSGCFPSFASSQLITSSMVSISSLNLSLRSFSYVSLSTRICGNLDCGSPFLPGNDNNKIMSHLKTLSMPTTALLVESD